MAGIASSIPNIIGGVSQQPPEIRQLNCSTALTNTVSSVTIGLTTRPGGVFVGTSGAFRDASIATHAVDRASGKFLMEVTGGEVRVFQVTPQGLTRAEVVVEDGAAEYLATIDPARDIGFVTVADTTFIYNSSRKVTVDVGPESGLTGRSEDDGVVRRSPKRYSTFWVRQRGTGELTFTLHIDGAEKANQLVATGEGSAVAIYQGLQQGLIDQGYNIQTVHKTLGVIQHPTEGVILKARDDYGNEGMLAYNGAITEFTDLPNLDIKGRVVMVSHAAEESADDYWVYFNGEAWVETYGWNTYEIPTINTMPIKLIHNTETGVWTLKRGAWAARTVGDENSNPTPSFVGRTINHMFLYKGRMCILSDENFIASRVSDFENFYRSTCTQLLDDDPIDVASPDSRGAQLRHAMGFDKSLLLFSSFDQYRVDGDGEGVLSPNSIGIKHVNSYNASPFCNPVYCGPNILFADDFENSRFAQVQQYQIERVYGREVALPATDQVPEYIPSGLYRMLESSTKNIAVALTKGCRSSIWLYNYYFNQEGQVQSAWQEWTLPGEVYGGEFVEDRLFLLMKHGTGLHWIEFSFHYSTDVVMSDKDILLDMGLPETRVTTALVGDASHVTLPYTPAPGSDISLTISTQNNGRLPKAKVLFPSEINGNTLVFHRVDLTTEKFVVGHRFEFYWHLSPIYLRDAKQVAVQDGRLQLRHLSFLYNNTGPFEVHMTPQGRQTYVSTYSGFRLGTSIDVLGEHSLNNGEHRVTASGRAESVSVIVKAKTPWRVRFSSLEWDGITRQKYQRL